MLFFGRRERERVGRESRESGTVTCHAYMFKCPGWKFVGKVWNFCVLLLDDVTSRWMFKWRSGALARAQITWTPKITVQEYSTRLSYKIFSLNSKSWWYLANYTWGGVGELLRFPGHCSVNLYMYRITPPTLRPIKLYKNSPYRLVLIQDKSSGCALGCIHDQTKHCQHYAHYEPTKQYWNLTVQSTQARHHFITKLTSINIIRQSGAVLWERNVFQ